MDDKYAEKVRDIDRVREIGRIFLDVLGQVGSNREISIAKTKVEEAVMWAVKGVTSNSKENKNVDQR